MKDRIKSLRRVRAGDLVPNPKNWRQHPEAQQKAMAAVLAEVGIADAVIARELPGGKLQLIDGHLRAGLDPNQKLPVLVLDVTEAEAEKLLATLDPLAGMAEANAEKLKELLAGIETESDEIQAIITTLKNDHGITPPDFQPVSADEQSRLDQKAPVTCPHCQKEFIPK